MQSIDIPAVMAARGLDKALVAAQMFPGHKHPALALNRVIKGLSRLTDEQISKLALLADLTPGMLFTNGPWEMRSKADLITFKTEDFIAELNTKTRTTRLFHNKSLFHETIFNGSGITLTDYLALLNAQILKFRTND